jgi:hypothetical protein
MSYMCRKGGIRECDGCGACQPEVHYYCPVCGEEVYETVFVNNDGEVIGCENCAEIKEPHELSRGEEE